MSKQTTNILWAIVIILFVLGIWPISLIIAAILLANAHKQKSPKPERNIEELEKENEALRAELANQAVRRAMDAAEKREKED